MIKWPFRQRSGSHSLQDALGATCPRSGQCIGGQGSLTEAYENYAALRSLTEPRALWSLTEPYACTFDDAAHLRMHIVTQSTSRMYDALSYSISHSHIAVVSGLLWNVRALLHMRFPYKLACAVVDTRGNCTCMLFSITIAEHCYTCASLRNLPAQWLTLVAIVHACYSA